MSLDLITETGSYSGNGSSQSVVIGTNWQPALVIVMSTRPSGPAAGRAITYKTPDMATDTALACNAAAELISTALTLASTGFSIGDHDDVNRNGIIFHWIAFRAGPWIDTGQYTGTGTAQPIATGRQPGAAFVFQTSGVERALWKFAAHGTSYAMQFQTALGWLSGQLTLQATGFQADGNANTDTETYVWAALYDIPGSTRHIESGSYTGDGSGPDTVTLGYQPKWVIVMPDTASGGEGGFKSASMGTGIGELTTQWDWLGTDGIAITSTGFTVDGVYNTNSQDYKWLVGVQ